MVIVHPPRFDLFLRVCKRKKLVRIQTLVLQRAVEEFHERVVGGLSGTRIIQRDTKVYRGLCSRLSSVRTAARITQDVFRCSASLTPSLATREDIAHSIVVRSLPTAI